MLIGNFLLIAALLVVSFSSGETTYTRFSRVLGLNGDRSSRVRKRQEEPRYFGQCESVDMWREHLGHVCVLAFLDPSWLYSLRQAVLLNALSSRMRKSGFPDIRFFVISPPPDLTLDDIEDDVEVEAWRQIAMFSDSENFLNINTDIFKEGDSEVIFLQDGPQFQMWKTFHASRNQVIVIDRCGRVTYQVIPPWSILYFPYVKATLLSTCLENPCGECNSSTHRPLDDKEYLSDLTNGTERETDPGKADNIDADPIRTTERLENATLRLNESLEEEQTESNIPPVRSDEATDNADRLDLASVTELPVKSGITYQFDNDTTESPTGESHPGSQGTPTNSNDASGTTSRSPEDDSARRGMKDRVLMLDAPATGDTVTGDGVSTRKMTISDDADDDGASSSDGNANNSSDNLSERGQSDSVDKSEVEDAARTEGVRFLPLPLRIIMYAPHVHGDSKKTKKYAHLILKIDDPHYHGHLGSEIGVTPADLPRGSDLQVGLNFKVHDQAEIKINGHTGDTDQNYIFDRDESPGLYGEVADYWRSYEDSDITDRNETTNDNYNNTTISHNEQQHGNATEHSLNVSKSSNADKNYSNEEATMDISAEDSVNPPTIGVNKINSLGSIDENEQIDREDEARNKLIEHYNKLLPWINYRLN